MSAAPAGSPVGVEDRGVAKSLRGLGAPEALARHRARNQHAPRRRPLEAVAHRERWQRTVVAGERVEGAVDHGLGYQGAGPVVDQHQVGGRLGQTFEAVPHRFLPRRAAGDRRQQRTGLRLFAPLHRVVVERPVGGVDHDTHAVDARVRRETPDAVTQHRAPRELAVLLGQRPADPVAAPGGDDQGGGGGHGAPYLSDRAVPAAGLEPATP